MLQPCLFCLAIWAWIYQVVILFVSHLPVFQALVYIGERICGRLSEDIRNLAYSKLFGAGRLLVTIKLKIQTYVDERDQDLCTITKIR